jgi:hypothetical protein
VPSNKQLFEFFGVSYGWAEAHKTSDHELLSELVTQWKAHCSAWRPPSEGQQVTPADTFDYWQSLKQGCLELSDLALHNWSGPVSNAVAERVFRIYSHMDDPTRQTMEHLSVENQLYLRVNKPIVMELADELVTQVLDRKSVATARTADAEAAAGAKRGRASGVESATVASAAAMAALRSGQSKRRMPVPRQSSVMSDGEEDLSGIQTVLALNNVGAAALQLEVARAGAASAAQAATATSSTSSSTVTGSLSLPVPGPVSGTANDGTA